MKANCTPQLAFVKLKEGVIPTNTIKLELIIIGTSFVLTKLLEFVRKITSPLLSAQ